MNEPKRSFGTLLKDDGKTLRSKTRLQWGESKQSIGSVIMLNPGSATLKSNKEWVTFLNSSMKTVSFFLNKIWLYREAGAWKEIQKEWGHLQIFTHFKDHYIRESAQ